MLQKGSLPHTLGCSSQPSLSVPSLRSSRSSRDVTSTSRNTHEMDDTHEKLNDPYKGHPKSAVQPLRYRTRALWLLGFYVLLIVIPWVLTCVLAHRPISASSYVRQQGFLNHEVSNMHKWKIAVDVLNAISGVITSKQHKYDPLLAYHTDYRS